MMKKTLIFLLVAVAISFMVWIVMPDTIANAEEILRYSCSAQIYEAFEMERIEAFTKATGIKVDLQIGSSGASVSCLINDFSDIASTVRRLHYIHQDYGCVETPFCRDPLAIITSAECGIENISETQLQQIFNGNITNWEEVGGSYAPITVIIPGKDTGAYLNFTQQALKQGDVRYAFTAYRSTMSIKLVEEIPCSISAISQAAALKHPGVKPIKINGCTPQDECYPYYQVFSYVTKGKPVGAAKKFIDFTFSPKGMAIMKKKGMLPVEH